MAACWWSRRSLRRPTSPAAKVTDLLMAAVGGRERTEQEWRTLLANGGFQLTKIRPGHSGSTLEAVPR
jgi:hypothetical protein